MQILIINIVVSFLIGLFIYLMPYNIEKKKKWFLVASFLQLWYVHSMVNVYSVPDLSAYKDYFEQSSHLTFSQSFIKGVLDSKIEIGFVVFFRLVGYLTGNFQFFLAIYSFILLLLYYRTIEQESPYVFCSIALLLVIPFNQSLFVIRQHLAIAILFSSFPLIRDRKLVKFLLVLFLAYLMHRTAIIFVFVYFLYGIKGEKTGLVLTISSVTMILAFNVALRYIGGRLGVYGSYLESDDVQNYIGIVISGVMLLTFWLIMKKNVWTEGVTRFSFVLILLYFIVSVGGLGSNPTGRLTPYFSIGAILLVPAAMKYLPSKDIRSVFFLIVFGAYLYLSYWGSSGYYIRDFELVSLL